MILVIDNYDSFTYNLVQFIGELGADPVVYRNDKISLEQIDELAPAGIIVSPGPGHPEEGGISVDLIRSQSGKVPILGVCLGHQSIAQATGATIARAKQLMHGKTDQIHHDEEGIFAGLPNPVTATRYHSLAIEAETLSEEFTVSAWAEAPDHEREIMAIRHREYPLEGWQFHPESFLTEIGPLILQRFLEQ